MECKYCGSELVEGKKFCPACGMDQEIEKIEKAEQEHPAAKKPAAGKIALAVAAVVVVLAALVALIVGGMDENIFSKPTESTEAPTEAVETVPPTVPADGNPDDVTCKGTYTVTDDEAIASAATVVATMGDVELTNGELQVYYWEEVYAFLQEYGSYASYFGLDYSLGLDVQMCEAAETPMTWQQFFLDSALSTWRSYQAMALEREANGIEMDADTQTYLDGLEEEMKLNAEKSGHESVEAMVRSFVGAGPTVEDYIQFIKCYYDGYSYFSHVYDNTLPTAEEVDAYFTEHEASYAEQGVTRDGGVYVDVRHILIQPEGGETGEDGYPVYTEEAWAAAKAEADRIYGIWKGGNTTEDRFGQLAQEYSVDGSASNGGLYTGVAKGQMVENFNNWCFDENRKEGDYDLIQTQFGYHIMYFVGSQDIWFVTAENDLITQTVSALVPAALEKHPAEVDYSAIKLGLVSLS
jgi:hypothetical protein